MNNFYKKKLQQNPEHIKAYFEKSALVKYGWARIFGIFLSLYGDMESKTVNATHWQQNELTKFSVDLSCNNQYFTGEEEYGMK